MFCVFSDLPTTGSLEVATQQTADGPISDPITEALSYAFRVSEDCFTHEPDTNGSANSDVCEEEDSTAPGSSDACEEEAHGSVSFSESANGSANSDVCEEEDSTAPGSSDAYEEEAHGSVSFSESDSESVGREGNVSESEDVNSP